VPRLNATTQPQDQDHADEFTRRMDAAREALTQAEAKAPPVAVRKCPTRKSVRCPRCKHSGVVAIMLDQINKLKCGKCGHADPIVSGRSPLRSWSTKRRGRS
jgi:ribosomal protein S27AE